MIIVIVINVLISSFGDEKSSNFSLGNTSALSVEWGCSGHADWIQHETLKHEKCPGSTTKNYLACQSEYDVCCNPSDQTTCN